MLESMLLIPLTKAKKHQNRRQERDLPPKPHASWGPSKLSPKLRASPQEHALEDPKKLIQK